MEIIAHLLELALMLAIAPLVSGFITKVKNRIRMRQGAGLIQPYYNLAKLCAKNEVVSENTSWIFRCAPFIVMASVVAAAFLTPAFIVKKEFFFLGDALALLFILSLGRFFLALAGLDTASAFAGMGSSREMFISTFAEPAALVSLLTVSLNAGSTNLAAISSLSAVRFSSLAAGFSLFMVILAETSRIPVDNQETHLELTMIHEAMTLEYSGRPLAFLEMAAYLKQIVFFSLLGNILWPKAFVAISGFSQWAIGGVFYLFKTGLIALVVAILEVSMAKMRLFRVVDFLSFAFVLSVMALIMSITGL